MEYSRTSTVSPSRLARISAGLCFCWVLAALVGCIDRPARVRPPSIITANADLPPEQQNLEAALVGLYKVQITHPNMDIPAKYNTKTELDADISRQEALEGISFNLTSG